MASEDFVITQVRTMEHSWDQQFLPHRLLYCLPHPETVLFAGAQAISGLPPITSLPRSHSLVYSVAWLGLHPPCSLRPYLRTHRSETVGWMRCSLRLTLRWQSLQEGRYSLCLSWVWVGFTISLTSIAVLAAVWRNRLCGPGRPVSINVNSETSCSWHGVTSDVLLQAFWLRRGRFLCDLTQLSMCLCRPQEYRQLPGLCQLPGEGLSSQHFPLHSDSRGLKQCLPECSRCWADRRPHGGPKPLGILWVEECLSSLQAFSKSLMC